MRPQRRTARNRVSCDVNTEAPKAATTSTGSHGPGIADVVITDVVLADVMGEA